MPQPSRKPGSSGKIQDKEFSGETTAETAETASAAAGDEAPQAEVTSPESQPSAASASAADPTVVGSGEFRSSADRRSGLVSGIHTFGVKRVTYSNVNGLGIFEGDINLGAVDTLEQKKVAADSMGVHSTLTASGRGRPDPNIQFSVAITGQRYRWPGGLIPYEVQPSIQPVVEEAIAHWQQRTSIRFAARTAANASSYPNYVSFEVGEGCFSAVGMQGGSQLVSIGLGCGVGQAIHEIGHAVGLWHEQSREDRDQFVRVVWENLLPSMEHNFDQHITDGDDIGPYDYDSVMHYPAKAFSANGMDTIVALGGQPIGQRSGLSDADVAAVLELYPGAVGNASHMYTSLILELVRAIRDQGYRSEGVGFYGWPLPVAGTVPLYRLSDPQGKELYTTSATEAYDGVSKGFTFSGVPCYLFPDPAAGLTPLFRLEGGTQRDSLFTTSLVEAQEAAAQGYTGQGIVGHVLNSYVPGTVPVYRLSKAG